MLTLTQAAMQIAEKAHAGQLRKYSNDPYIVHPGQVVGILCTFVGYDDHLEFFQESIAAAWLHDVIEDCGYTQKTLTEELLSLTGLTTASLHVTRSVFLLSDLEEGNRAARKKLTRERLASCAGSIQNIKCADILSNLSSIFHHDKKFAPVFIGEAIELVSLFENGNMVLKEHTLAKLREASSKIKEELELQALENALMKN